MKIYRIAMLMLAAVTANISFAGEKLVILHTNDTHSAIDPTADGKGGVANRKALIDSVRDAELNTLLVDLGDMVQGSLFFNIYKGEVEEKVSNMLGYDIRILGNHEFDNGMDLLAENLSHSNAQLLAGNYLFRGTELQGLFKPYSIVDIEGARLAFLPVNLQPAGMITPCNYEGMGYLEPAEYANNMAWFLKNVEQADMVIALTHIGYDVAEDFDDVDLIHATKDIDLVLGGHSHTVLDPANPSGKPTLIPNAEGRLIPVAQTGRYGNYVGKVEIDLDDITSTPVTSLIPVDNRFADRVDPEVEEMLAPYRAKVDELNHHIIARSARALDRSSADLLNFGSDFVAARGRQLADGVDFAILNKGGLRQSLPAGDVSQGQIISMMPFFNRIEVIDIPGHKLVDAFNTMAKANGNGVSSEVTASYNPDTHTCVEILINGEPLDPDRMYRVASIDYLILGGDYMEALKDNEVVAVSPNIMFEDLIDYLTTGPHRNIPINPSGEKRMYPVR